MKIPFSGPDRLRFIVVQLGARMHYAIPAILSKAGMLERFYTDVCASVGWPSLLRRLIPDRLRTKSLQRLFGRVLPDEIDPSRVSTCGIPDLVKAVQIKRGGSTFEPLKVQRMLLHKVIKDRFLNANALYTNCINSDIDLVRDANQKGIFVVHEVMINADVGRILREERRAYPGIEPQESEEMIEAGIRQDLIKWKLSDLILVPSEFVRESALRLGADPAKIAVVPYGVDEHWFLTTPLPKRGRVLFVGSVGLRKGSHHLAQAARILRQKNVTCDVRVVGPRTPNVMNHPEFIGPNYIGQCPRSRVKSEFLEADIFVLPSLSEGCALAHLEAMASGLPVITTPNCGSVVRDGVDGFVVPIRDPIAIADRIECLLADDQLRMQMSQNARQRAREFTWNKYGERFLAAVRTATARAD